MRLTRRHGLLLLPWFLIPSLGHASVVLTVDGVDDTLRNAVVAGVGLSQYTARDVTDAQIRRLNEKAPDEVQAALRPYGYYEATATNDLKQVGKDWQVTLHVKPGTPVTVKAVNVSVDADATAVPAIKRAVRGVSNLKDKPLNDGQYEASRDAVSGALTATGFLDAKLVAHRVEVNRAEHTATVELTWEAGERYRYGTVVFKNSQFRDGFLDRYVPFKKGDYFSQSQLLELQQALNGADYFGVVNVIPDTDNAKDGTINIDVELAPAPRTIYSGGPFFGTDTGPGLRGGIEKRWINDRGHKWKNELVVATRLKTLSTLYSIPMPGPNQRSFNFGANYRDANTVTSKSRTVQLVANETRLWHGWQRTIGINALSGTFTVGKRGGEGDNAIGLDHGRSTLVYPEVTLSRKRGDNPTFVRSGWSLSLTARSTAGTLLSDARFSQVLADAKWIQSFLGRNRLILRGSAGKIWTDDFSALPPQLRFFAGGDRSVRGYDFESIGPRNAYGRVIGGENLLVGSTEVEHYFTRNWGMAAFVDAGNAFAGTDYKPRIGTGLGVRWLSPVGMIRADIGVPVGDKNEHGIHLHVVIGPDL